MIVCPVCGAHNDPGNHFCDQCGTRLDDPKATTQEAPAPPAEQPTAATTLACPNCGASVLLGQAFCDECGYPLNKTYDEYTASDAPTMVAPPELSPEVQTTADEAPSAVGITQVDQAQTTPASAATAEPDVAPIPTPPPDSDETVVAPAPEPTPAEAAPVATVDEAVTAPDPALGTAPDDAAPPPPPPTTEEPPAPTPDPVAPAPATEPPEPAPDPVASAPAAEPAAEPATNEEQQRLEGLIQAHQDTISQYEQMMERYPAGEEPPFLAAGLDEARKALAQAEADLAILPIAATDTGPDPAEVQRLEGLIQAHQDTVGQYEQMMERYPAGEEPSFLAAGLDEARKALAQAEADLAALHGVPAPAATAPTGAAAPPAAAMPAAPATTMPTAEEDAVAATPVTIPPAPAPVEVKGPRLVLEDGQELSFPPNKTEIIVGREDPVSQIYPEIDLTPFGGESGGVSRQHARITQSNGQWAVTDLDSTNYTRVDGNRIEPNTPVSIQDGVQLQFGRIATTFHA